MEVDLEELGSVGSHPCTLADNLGWEDEVIKDRLVDLCECVLSRPELLKLTSTSGLFSDDLSLGDDQDWLARELLLELLNEGSFLDNLLELCKLWHWDEDHDALLAPTDVNLLGRGDVNLTKRTYTINNGSRRRRVSANSQRVHLNVFPP